MKWSFLFYSAFTVSLLGCQYLPASFAISDKKPPPPTPIIIPEPVVHQHEQIVKYGTKFALEYSLAPEETCTKFEKIYQQGDWRAGWVLALQVTENSGKQCLNIKQAVQVLTLLESEKKIDPDLIWLNQYHLRLLHKLQQKTKKVSQLNSALRSKKKKIVDLLDENQALVEKLEALKAIETSIN